MKSEGSSRLERDRIIERERLLFERPDKERSNGPSFKPDTGKSRPHVESNLSRTKIGVSMGGNAMIAMGGGVGVGGQIGGNAAINDGRGALSAGMFLPTSGVGLAVAKLGPALEVAWDGADASMQTPSTINCVRQVMLVTPVFSLTMQVPDEKGAIGNASVSLGVTLGLGVFAGYYCGFEIKPGF